MDFFVRNRALSSGASKTVLRRTRKEFGAVVTKLTMRMIRLRRKDGTCTILGPCVRETSQYYIQGGPTEHRRHKSVYHVEQCESCPRQEVKKE